MKFKKFTLIELMVVIAIIGILISILMPSLKKARQKAYGAVCISNQKQIGIADISYVQDYGRHIPMALDEPAPPGSIMVSSYAHWWPDLLGFTDVKQFSCPSVPEFGIGINHADIGLWRNFGFRESDIADPVNTVFFADTAKVLNLGEPNPDKWQADESIGYLAFRTPNNNPWYSDTVSGGQRAVPRHAGRVSALFMDGHASSVANSFLGFQYSNGHVKALWDKL